MDSTRRHCAWELQNYVPPSNMATQADMAQRKVMDMRRWQDQSTVHTRRYNFIRMAFRKCLYWCNLYFTAN